MTTKKTKGKRKMASFENYRFVALWNSGEYVNNQEKYFDSEKEARIFQDSFFKQNPNGTCKVLSREAVRKEERIQELIDIENPTHLEIEELDFLVNAEHRIS